MTTEGYRYEGTEYLKLGEESLANYNASIAKMVRRFAGDARDVMDFGAGIGTLSIKVRSLGLDPLCVEPDHRQRTELARRGFRTAGGLDDIDTKSKLGRPKQIELRRDDWNWNCWANRRPG